MSDPRAQILGSLRRALGREAPAADIAAGLERRLAEHPANLVPRRTDLPGAALIDLFVRMAEAVSTTVDRVPDAAAVPASVAEYLARHNLPTEIVMAPDPALDAIPWDSRPLLAITRGRAQGDDAASLTGAFAGIAETGTLMLLSGPGHPTTLNFLPDTHVVVLRASQVVGPYEEAWRRLRARADGGMPRTVNLVTGPSRTGDIELKIQLGAHGPRRLHIVLIDDAPRP
ncbi:MAG: lactate utilization protein C [Alphaproteobacteria bacterium]|nr:lactate utilization protein C [Alphaproteobacteria bacterium]